MITGDPTAREAPDREASPMPRQPDVFVSYSSSDTGRVRAIVDRLTAAGISVWRDQSHIPGGTVYGPEIVRAIRSSRVLLLMCSQAALASPNVRQEVLLAWRFRVPLLPVLLERVEVGDELLYWLEGRQWVSVDDRPDGAWLPEVLAGLGAWGVCVAGEGPQTGPGAAKRLSPGLDGLWAAAAFTDRIRAFRHGGGPDSRHFRLGDHVRLSIDVWADGHLLLLNRGPEGAVYCLCPSAFAPRTCVRAGRLELPLAESPYPAFEIKGMPGREDILAIVTADPLHLDWMPTGEDALERPARVLSTADIDDVLRRLDRTDDDRYDALATWFDVS